MYVCDALVVKLKNYEISSVLAAIKTDCMSRPAT